MIRFFSLTHSFPSLAMLAAVILIGGPGIVLADTSCDEAREIRSALSGFELRASSSSVQLNLCESKSVFRNLGRGLAFLKSLPELPSARDQLDRGSLPSRPYDFLKKRIQTIVIAQPMDSRCNGLVAAFTGADGPKGIRICPNLSDANPLTMAAALIHEARHLDLGGSDQAFPHVRCRQGSESGLTSTCDESLSSGGAYAVQIEFYVRLSRLPNISDELRIEARNSAAAYYLNRINQIKAQNQLMFLTADGQLMAFDGSRSQPLDNFDLKKEAVLMAGSPIYVLNRKTGKAQRWYSRNLRIEAQTTLTDLFARELSDEDRQMALDFYATRDTSGISYSCVLLKSEIACKKKTENSDVIRLALGSIRPSRLVWVFPTPTDRRSFLAIQDEQLNLYELPSSFDQLKNLRTTELISDRKSEFISQMMTNDGRPVALTPDGQLQYPGRPYPFPAAGLENVRVAKILGARAWSPDLDRL